MMSSDANNNKKMNLPPLRFNSVTKHESFLSNKQLPRILTSPKSLGIKQSLSPRRLAKPDPTVDQEGAHANDQDADKKRPLSMYTCVSPTPWSILRSRSTEASKSSLMRPKSQPSINLLDNDDSLVLSPVRSKSSWRKELSQKIKYIDAVENSPKTLLLPEKENGSRSEHSQVQSSEEKTEDSINLPSNENKREITKHVNFHSLQDLSSNLDGVPSYRPDSQVINSYNEQKINGFSDNIISKQSTNLSTSTYTSKTAIALGNKQFFKKLDSPCSKAIEDAKSVPLLNDNESKDDNGAKDLLNFSEIPQPIYENNVNVNTDPNGHDFRSNSPLAVVLPGCSGRCVLIPEDDKKEVVPLPPKSSASKPSRGRAKKFAAVVSTITPVREEHGDHECFIEDKKAKDKLQDCPKSVEVSDNPDFANVIQTSLDEKASSETTGYHKNVPLENEICISGLLPGDNQHDTKKCSTHMHNDNNDGETCLSYNTSKCEQTDLNVPDSSQASNLLPVKGSEVNLPEKISFTSINNLTTSNVIENECTDTIINEMSKKDSRTKHPKGHKMTPLLAVLDQPMPSPRRRPRVSRRMSDKPIHLDDDEFVGFATLPDQVHRKAVKRGFDFNLMVVGETGLGKSTLINSLFLTDLYNDRTLPNVADSVKQTVNIEKKTLEIEERGVKLRLTIVDTPGFNDNLNCEESWKTIPNYINDQFEQYYQAESGLNRKNIQDTRIHCLLYFISPYGHGLRPVDIMVMKHLHNKVNIVPLVAKADILTPKEVKKLKERILQEIEDNHINIYQFPDCDSDEDEGFKEQDKALKAAVPFAVVGSNTILEVGGKKVRGRMYPWGIVEVDNPKHCDFTKLRQMLISTHMQDLKDITADVHYENFRAEHLAAEMKNTQKERNKLKRDSVTGLDKVADTDLLLQQKEAEIQRMQAMLAKMQAQLQNGGS